MKLQAVAYYDTIVAEWFIRLHSEINLENIEKFMKKKVKIIVRYTLDFALVVNIICSSEKFKYN